MMDVWLIWMVLGAAAGAVVGSYLWAEAKAVENERLRAILGCERAARECLEAWMDAAWTKTKGNGNGNGSTH